MVLWSQSVVRKTMDNLYRGQAILCILIFGVALLKQFNLTPASLTGIDMWQAWAVVGLISIMLRLGDALVLLGGAVTQGVRRIAGYSFTPLPPKTFTRIAGLIMSAAGYALALITPLLFIIARHQFAYIAIAPWP
jgi:hypothetical protein